MCVRFAQYRGLADFVAELNSERDVISGYDNVPLARYNVAPSTRVHMLYGESRGIHLSAVRWTKKGLRKKGRIYFLSRHPLWVDSVEKVALLSALRQNLVVGRREDTQHDGTVIEWTGAAVLLIQP